MTANFKNNEKVLYNKKLSMQSFSKCTKERKDLILFIFLSWAKQDRHILVTCFGASFHGPNDEK